MTLDTKHSFRPVSGREIPRFSGIKTFMRLPYHSNPADVDVMIKGIPWDGLTSYRPGARFGPNAVREATSLGRAYHWEHQIAVFDALKVCDGGDIFVNILNATETFRSIETSYSEILQNNCHPIAVGGDHSITLPCLRALHAQVKKPIALFHVDAHADTYGPAWGVEIHHGTFVRHAIDENLIDPKMILQVGLRGGLTTSDDFNYGKDKGIQVLESQEIQMEPWSKTLKYIDRWKKQVGDQPVYLSFDIDGIDPAFAPATGAPVPGGLASWQALSLLQSLRGVRLMAADLVEISPAYDHGDITAILGMSLLFEFLALFAASR